MAHHPVFGRGPGHYRRALLVAAEKIRRAAQSAGAGAAAAGAQRARTVASGGAARQLAARARILAAGLVNRDHDREIVKEAVENAGRHVVPELERYLRSLGTIAAISPFLGLFGTVIGMIQMFSGIGQHGVGDPSIVAAGISTALITTAGGLAVAIPSLMFYRYFRGRVNELLLEMEQEAVKLVEILHGERESEND